METISLSLQFKMHKSTITAITFLLFFKFQRLGCVAYFILNSKGYIFMSIRHPLNSGSVLLNPTKQTKNYIYAGSKIPKHDGSSQVTRHLLRFGRCNVDYFETQRRGISNSYSK